eukprot:14654808-Alexandrium_andersonii.AAC.3
MRQGLTFRRTATLGGRPKAITKQTKAMEGRGSPQEGPSFSFGRPPPPGRGLPQRPPSKGLLAHRPPGCTVERGPEGAGLRPRELGK